MKAYHIYLLRNGMTRENKEGKYIGRLDPPLSYDGEQEVAGMKRKYVYPPADMFFSSPMKRCLRTLELLYPESEPEILDNLTECGFGNYEGKTMAQLKDDPLYQKWASGAADCPPNGESSKKFQLRCCSEFEKIADRLMRSGKTSAVIMAHGGTIMSILGVYAFPRRPMYEWMTGNAMGYETVITPSLWLSGKALEVAGAIPLQNGEPGFGRI